MLTDLRRMDTPNVSLNIPGWAMIAPRKTIVSTALGYIGEN